jgi:2-methylcitrate dehydratase PrpD
MERWEAVVREAVTRRWDEQPTEVRRRATELIVDTVATMIGGGRQAPVRRVATTLLRTRGVPDRAHRAFAPTLGHAPTDTATAAFLNGLAGTWIELDESADAGVHAAVHVLAGLLPVAQARRATGRDVVSSFLAGYEVTARLYELFPVRYPVHPHGGLAAIGPAVAVARLDDADPLAAARIAGSLPIVTTWDACFAGGTVRHAFAGTAAAAGVQAAALAASGLTAPAAAIPTLYGGITGTGLGSSPRASDATPAVMRATIKLHSACLTCHTAIDAALSLGPVDATQIDGVLVHTTDDVREKVDRQAERNELSTRFSLPYAVAAALVHGHARPVAFQYDDRVAAIAARVEVATDEFSAAGDAHHLMPARVAVRVGDATLTSGAFLHPTGHPSRPLTRAQLRRKYADLLGDPDGVAGLAALDEVEDVARVIWPGRRH